MLNILKVPRAQQVRITEPLDKSPHDPLVWEILRLLLGPATPRLSSLSATVPNHRVMAATIVSSPATHENVVGSGRIIALIPKELSHESELASWHYVTFSFILFLERQDLWP